MIWLIDDWLRTIQHGDVRLNVTFSGREDLVN